MAKTFFGHPRGLLTLFSTEFWERFSYYGMRGFFVLYLTATLADGGFGLEKTVAYSIYGVFTALVYITPIIGGILADKILGQRKAIYIGALLMALGQFVMAYSGMIESGDIENRKLFLFLGLGFLILGNGFFKPNISTMVGGLYSQDNPNKDGGFTIFYMGINLGAFVTNFVGGTLAESVGWQYGFLVAGIGLVVATIWFFLQETTIVNEETKLAVGLHTNDDPKKLKLDTKDWSGILIYFIGLSLLTTAIVFGIVKLPQDIVNIAASTLGIGGALFLGYTIFKNTSGKVEWNRVGVILILAIFNIIFWSGFEQAGTSFNTFANEYTDRDLGFVEVKASWFQSINALFIFILAPIFTVLWKKLSAKKLNPTTPNKFAFSLIFLSVGFFIMQMAENATAGHSVLISPMWLVMVYLFHTVGELLMSPIGLSMITKLSPPKIVSVMMGLWMGSIALGNFLAAEMTKISTALEFDTFTFIAVYALIAAGIAFLLGPLMRKMMGGIH